MPLELAGIPGPSRDAAGFRLGDGEAVTVTDHPGKSRTNEGEAGRRETPQGHHRHGWRLYWWDLATKMQGDRASS
jgi:hypothetical protein